MTSLLLAVLCSLTAQAAPGSMGPTTSSSTPLGGLEEAVDRPADGSLPGPEAIVNGQLEAGWPQTVALGAANFSACTGSVIAPRVVLTAGHCGADFPVELLVEFGQAIFGPDVNDATDRIGFASFEVHPDYDPLSGGGAFLGEFDIALLELTEDAPVEPIRFRTQRLGKKQVGATVVSVGFGITSAAGAGGGTKRSAELVVDEIDNMFVLSDVSTNKDGANICSGDSGGPQYYFDEVSGEWEQWAVHSWGDGNCVFNSGSTRTDVAADFILDFVEKVHGSRDFCEYTGRYDDGVCDLTCDHLDPDCMPTEAALTEAYPGGCDHTGGGSVGWVGLLALLGLRRRR